MNIDIDIASDSALKQKLPTIPLSSLGASLIEKYPEVSKRAAVKLLAFPSICLCESGYSLCSITKTKCRN
jgi:hypothetical protein